MTVKAIDHIPYILIVPLRSDYSAVPLVIFQHGINSDRSAALTVANSYAAHGYATLGIDELWHGSRLPGNVDNVFNLSGQPGHDGIGDPTASGAVQYFFDFQGDANNGVLPVDPHYIRDNFRQAEIDLMQEVRLARGGDLSAVAAALPQLASLGFDGSKVVYTGESFGSIMGAAVLAVDPLLEAAVLDVGGAGILSDLAPNAPSFATLLQPFIAGAFDTIVDVDHPDTEPVRAQMSLNLVQEVIDPGDGLALAAGADPTKNVLFLFAYLDETVPNQSNQALARGWGATEVPLTAGSHPLEQAKLPDGTRPVHGVAAARGGAARSGGPRHVHGADRAAHVHAAVPAVREVRHADRDHDADRAGARAGARLHRRGPKRRAGGERRADLALTARATRRRGRRRRWCRRSRTPSTGRRARRRRAARRG